MRTIKFRAWDKERAEYLSAGRVFIPIYPHSNPKDCNDLHLDSSSFLAREGRMILEQYTGLKDINGVEIYEGDLLSELDPVSFMPMEVIFDDGAFEINDWRLTEKLIQISEKVVVGNKYENPELLEPKND